MMSLVLVNNDLQTVGRDAKIRLCGSDDKRTVYMAKKIEGSSTKGAGEKKQALRETAKPVFRRRKEKANWVHPDKKKLRELEQKWDAEEKKKQSQKKADLAQEGEEPIRKADRKKNRGAEGKPASEKGKKPSGTKAQGKVGGEKKNRTGQRGKSALPKIPGAKLKVISLGGLQEIGKNITVLEYGDDILVVDCGMGFPDEEMPGIDLVIPDLTYLEKNKDRVRGVLLTHGHEDHIGGIPYLLRVINTPVYGTGLTIGILKYKLEEFHLENKPDLRTVSAGDVVELGCFRAEFIHVNHSIADSCAIAIETPVGMVVHSGDFKLDVSPIDGKMMDVVRLGEIGNGGVKLLLCESTNAERPGFTPSEKKVGSTFEQLFSSYKENRLVIATFSSNVHRVQQIIDAAARHGRKVCVLGRSMVNVVSAARELGYMEVPENTLIDVSELKKYPPEKVALVTTGSQGEPMSALYRIAFGEHDRVKISPTDVVILSATAIPGNEKLVGKIINALVKNGVRVIHDNSINVHVSGHACQEELKMMQALVRPEYFMPIHGEYRHLYANKDLAEFMGMAPDRIFISELGRVLEIDEHGARWNGSVPSGRVLVDGSGVGDVGNVVLRDRKNLAQDGLVVVVATVDMESHLLLSGPDIVSRGFVYVREAEELMEEARRVAQAALQKSLGRKVDDWMQLKTDVKEELAKFLLKSTKRKPMILPVIMDL